jgi:hypothetical protein
MIQEQVTPEEWRMLCAAPWAVGWYMATAIGGKVQEVRELLTLRTTLHRALERDCEHSTAEQLEKEPLDCHNRVLRENARQRRSEHPYANSSHQQDDDRRCVSPVADPGRTVFPAR